KPEQEIRQRIADLGLPWSIMHLLVKFVRAEIETLRVEDFTYLGQDQASVVKPLGRFRSRSGQLFRHRTGIEQSQGFLVAAAVTLEKSTQVDGAGGLARGTVLLREGLRSGEV